jgi:uncharacterized damage-inducible protein DinB
METRHLVLAFALATTPTSAVAQTDAGMAAVKPLYENVKGWLIQSVEQMPEEHFSFKPTPEVRSFGELMGHVANATYMFCAGATGEANPNSTDYEKASSKEDLVAGVAAAFAYCDSAYQMSETKALEEVTLFGQAGTRLWVLMFNVSHDWQHYGNVVTYMRLKGMVPPSSQGGM